MTECQDREIQLAPLSIRKDRQHYIVADLERQEYYEMPEICVEAIRGMQAGVPLDKIEAGLRARYPGEEINMDGFVRQLRELGLLRSWNGQRFDPPQNLTGRNRAVSQGLERLGRVLFHPLALALYGLLALANALQLVSGDGLMPVYSDLFLSSSMTVNLVSWMAVGLTGVVLHECGHSLAMAAKGLPTRWNMGHRLFLPVLETEMSGVWSLPPGQRYVPYLAGMCVDQVLLFAALFVQTLLPETSGWAPVLRMAALHLVLALGYQLLFFMKTDLYYVVENALGSYNLMENALAWLTNALPFRRAGERAEPVIYEDERHVVRLYGLFVAAGAGVSLALLVFYLIPQLGQAVRMTLPRLALAPSEPLFWDAVVFYFQFLCSAAWVLSSWIRSVSGRRGEKTAD